jgi:fibronectin-binding autotransporter adhesin
MLNNDYMKNKMVKITSKTSLLLLVGLASILAAGTGQTAMDVWSGATSSDWSTGSNWSTGLAPTSADVARFGYSTQSTPTLGAGLFEVQRMYFQFSGTKTSYNITGAGSAITTLKINPNTDLGFNMVDNVATTGGSNQTFSNLTLLLEDSNTTGQLKITPGVGGITIASNAILKVGSTTAQAVIVEANNSQTGSGTLSINGALTAGFTGSSILVDKSGVLNLNLAAGSDFTNLQVNTAGGGIINFFTGGNLGGSVQAGIGGSVVNLATSGITLGTTAFSIADGGKISTTYTSGTSTLGEFLTLANGTGTRTFDVASGGTLALTGRVQLGSPSANVEKTGNGTLALTYSGGAGNSFLASAFNVRAGTLLVNNTGNTTASAAAVNIFSGATLAGAGRITGATTISGILEPGNLEPGNLEPGNGIGTIKVANDVTWNGGASPSSATDWKFQLGAANAADLLNILNGVTPSEFIKGTGTTFRFDFLGSTATGTFKLVGWESTASVGGGVAGTSFAATDFSYTNLDPGLKGSFQFNGNQLEFVSENKSIPSITTPPTASAITVGEALSSSALANDGVASTAGTFTFTDPSFIPSTTGNYSASVTFTPDDLANYVTVTTTVSVTVNPETPIGTTFAGWSSSATPTPELVAKYAIGGANSLTGESVRPISVLDDTTLSITAIVRTDDPDHLTVVGQAVTSLADYATPGSGVEVLGDATGIDQTDVPTGCEKQKFSVNRDGAARMFLRLNSTLTP